MLLFSVRITLAILQFNIFFPLLIWAILDFYFSLLCIDFYFDIFFLLIPFLEPKFSPEHDFGENKQTLPFNPNCTSVIKMHRTFYCVHISSFFGVKSLQIMRGCWMFICIIDYLYPALIFVPQAFWRLWDSLTEPIQESFLFNGVPNNVIPTFKMIFGQTDCRMVKNLWKY